MEYTNQLLQFIKNSPSAFHVIGNMKKELEEAGFSYLPEGEPWKIESGKAYYTTRNEASLIAWRMPEGRADGFHIAAAHSDSPSFYVKEHPEMNGEAYVRINTEKYGGMILSTWLDRPLSIAGRVTVQTETGLESRLVNIDSDLLVIPNVAIHMERKANQGYEYKVKADMAPIFAEKKGKTVRELVAKEAGVPADKILGSELYLYVRDEGRIVGRDGEWILSPRLDDQQCVYGILQGMKEETPSAFISMAAVFHNEEVGSTTRQGADSTFLSDVLTWIGEAVGDGEGERRRKITRSFLISADNAHAVHPNHPEKADSTNQPELNGGVVMKFHGNQKYTSDAVTAGFLRLLCTEAGVSCQTYHNQSDIVGGSTLGNISTSHVSIPSVDIGLPQLAMHSAVETAGSRDLDSLIRLLRVFYRK